MKHHPLALLLLLFCLGGMTAKCQTTNRVRYTLLNPSYFADDCLLCGRPTILEPLRGTFDLVLIQDIAPQTSYAVENVRFIASPRSTIEKSLTGEGTYKRFEEFALTQDMQLNLGVTANGTDQPAYFTNDTPLVEKPFPLLQLTLTQTNGTFAHTFSIHVLAAPVQDLWFSTTKAWMSTNLPPPSNILSGGDLLSMSGRIVKHNSELVERLGVMPPVPDLGLDAVDVQPGGEILFSVPEDVFSETLGPIQHGDLLSDRGRIVKRNQELLGAFGPTSTNDAGLDGVQVLSTGEILFSIQSNVLAGGKMTLSRGDILSDQGSVYMTHQELMAEFQPTLTNYDFGVRAFRVLPSGEVWFAVEEGFTDNNLGTIRPGDLLSSFGNRVFSNQDLVANFAPGDPTSDYGLDALFVVTDTEPPKPPPLISTETITSGSLHLEWDGSGAVFQVETSPTLLGPWIPVSPILPGSNWDVPVNNSGDNAGFFRLRQW